MPYLTGNANSYADLNTALVNACVANGWALTSGILHRGDCYISQDVQAAYVDYRAGLGQSGGVLTTPAPNTSGGSRLQHPLSSEAISWPATYHIHIIEDEVYMMVNWGGDKWMHVAFGISPIKDDFVGAGVWVSAMGQGSKVQIEWRAELTNFQYVSFATSGLFNTGSVQSSTANNFIYHDATGVPGWSSNGHGDTSVPGSSATTFGGQRTMMVSYDNPGANWNNQGPLYRIQPCIGVASSKVCIVGDLKHARYLRIDNYLPGDILTLGPDKWKVYPFYKKNAGVRNGGSNHSGTLGQAIRYDGP